MAVIIAAKASANTCQQYHPRLIIRRLFVAQENRDGKSILGQSDKFRHQKISPKAAAPVSEKHQTKRFDHVQRFRTARLWLAASAGKDQVTEQLAVAGPQQVNRKGAGTMVKLGRGWKHVEQKKAKKYHG